METIGNIQVSSSNRKMHKITLCAMLLVTPHVAKYAGMQSIRLYNILKKTVVNIVKQKRSAPSLPSLEIDKYLSVLEVSGDVFVLEPLYVAIAYYVHKKQDELKIKATTLKMTSEAGFIYTIPKDNVVAIHNGNKLKLRFNDTSICIETKHMQDAMAFVDAAKRAYKGGKEMDMYG